MAINIFHLLSDKVWGGVEQYVYDLAASQKQDGNYVEIVCNKCETILNRLRELELPISILPLKGLTDIDSPVRFARLIKKGHNIVHVHNVRDAATAILARHISENRNTAIILTCHAVSKPKGGIIYKKIYRELDKIIFVSELAKSEFLLGKTGVNPSKLEVVHDSVMRSRSVKNAVDIRKQYNIMKDKKLIMFHGHISEEKGVSVLLRALTQLDKSRFHLVVIGEGELKYMGIIKAFIVANQLIGNVTLLGYQDEVQSLISQCDFGVLPSVRREAFGLPNLEYMMLGKAHIATDNGAQKEYMENGKTGILVPPDDYKALADSIEALIDDSELCEAIGARANKEFDDTLDYPHFVARIRKVYSSVAR